MVNCLNKFQPVRLVGRPVFIRRNQNTKQYNVQNHDYVVGFAERVFVLRKPETLTVVKRHVTETETHI